jgi:hypothetical protein
MVLNWLMMGWWLNCLEGFYKNILLNIIGWAVATQLLTSSGVVSPQPGPDGYESGNLF